MNNTLSISPVTEQDIPAVTQVVNSAYLGEPGSKSWTSEGHLVSGVRTSPETMLDLIKQPGITILKCSNAVGEILGSVLLQKKDNALYLGMLSVSPKAQAAGIGGLLLKHADLFAREHHYDAITITVIEVRHELIDWYRRKGYIPTGKLIPFYNPTSTALDSFSFLEMRKTLS